MLHHILYPANPVSAIAGDAGNPAETYTHTWIGRQSC